MVKQILHALQRMINETGSLETWDERLPMALLGLCTAPNASTKHSQHMWYMGDICVCQPSDGDSQPTQQQTQMSMPNIPLKTQSKQTLQ